MTLSACGAQAKILSTFKPPTCGSSGAMSPTCVFTGDPFGGPGLGVPQCAFFQRQFTDITTAVFEKDASRGVGAGGQILKHLYRLRDASCRR